MTILFQNILLHCALNHSTLCIVSSSRNLFDEEWHSVSVFWNLNGFDLGWYTFRPKVLSESNNFFYTFRPVADVYYLYVITLYDSANQNFISGFGQKLLFMLFGQIDKLYVSAKNYKIYVSTKIRFSIYFFFYKGKGKGGSLQLLTL